MTRLVILLSAPLINQKHGKERCSHMKGCTDQRTIRPKYKTTGTLKQEDVYELPFNETNLKSLLDLRVSDSEITFTVKEEGSGKAVEVKKDVNINKPIELFLKPFDYLFEAKYIPTRKSGRLGRPGVESGFNRP